MVEHSKEYTRLCVIAASCEKNHQWALGARHWREAAVIAPRDHERDTCLEFASLCEAKIPVESRPLGKVYVS